MRADMNASYLVKEVPDALIASLSLSILDKANLNSLDQLEGRSWSGTQVNTQTRFTCEDLLLTDILILVGTFGTHYT